MLYRFVLILLTIYPYVILQGNKDSDIFNLLELDEKVDTLIRLAKTFQNTNPDSSLIYINEAINICDEEKFEERKAKALNILGKIYKNKNQLADALETYKLDLEIRQKLKQERYVARAYNNIGQVYSDLGRFDKAIENYMQSKICKEKTNDKKGTGIVLTNMGNATFLMGNYDESIQLYQEALDIFEELDFKLGIIHTLNGIGLVFENLSNFNKAIESYTKALEISKEIGDVVQVANLYHNIGNVYTLQDDYDKALEYYKDALDIREEMNDRDGIAGLLHNIGYTYISRKEYKKALEYLHKALKINKQIDDNYDIILSYNTIGICYRELGDFNKANEFLNRSLDIANELDVKELIQQNYKEMSILYELAGNKNKALELYKLHVEIKDSIYNIELHNRISELQAKYETEKKEKEINILSKENEIQKLQLSQNRIIIIGLLALFIIAILIAILLVRQFRLKAKSKTIELEQKLLRTQMNPHFIFNSLTSIQNVIFEDDKLLAGQYIADFASLMRLILENSKEEFVTLDKEIDTLKYYIELQKLRYEGKFDYQINIDPELNTDLVLVPPMLAQPFVENSIKHGFINMEKKGMISIDLKKENNHIKYDIMDNGIGREKSNEIKRKVEVKYKSFAIEITKERLARLKRNRYNKYLFKITDLKEDNYPTGTLVSFSIPIIFVT